MPSRSTSKRSRSNRGSRNAAPKKGTLGISAFILGIINFFLFLLGLTLIYLLPEEDTVYDVIPLILFCLFVLGIVVAIILAIFSFVRKEPSKVLAVIGAAGSLVLGILLFLFFVLGILVYVLGLA